MRKRISEFSRKEMLFEPGDGVVIGVSGGADSVALLHVFCGLRGEWDLKLAAVHVHHGIRGEEAFEDMGYVEKLCREWGVCLFCFVEDVPQMARENRLSLEEAGRMIRYQRLEEVRRQLDYDRIAVAHHMDDLAETVLMNLARGSGLKGMAGIAARRDRIIRPFLCVRRQEIEDYLIREGIGWQTDRTNLEDTYLRNRIRRNLLPELTSACNERAVEHIAAAAADLQEADAWFCREAERLFLEETGRAAAAGNGTETGGAAAAGNGTEAGGAAAAGNGAEAGGAAAAANGTEAGSTAEALREQIGRLLAPPAVRLNRKLFLEQPRLLLVYLIRHSLRELGAGLKDISRKPLESVIELAKGQSGRRMELPGGVHVLVSGDFLWLSAEEKREVPEFSVRIRVFPVKNAKKVPQNCCVNRFDYDTIKNRLILRNRMAGDLIGVGAGKHRKLKQCLIDSGMPVWARSSWPLLAEGNRILWIPGYRMDESCRVTERTRLVLEVELIWEKASRQCMSGCSQSNRTQKVTV